MIINSKIPAYKSMYNDLRKKIESNQYKVGLLLPPEPELELEYGVSRTTVRRAVDLLMKDNLISVKQGYGTEIINNKVSQNLNRVISVSQTLTDMGYKVGVQDMYINRIKANDVLARELCIEVDDPIIEINRIQTANGVPITIAKNYICEKYVPGMLEAKEEIVSLYDYIKKNYGITITQLDDRISACNASYEEARTLQIEPKAALITIRRICYNGKIPFEVDQVKIIADKYEYTNNYC